MLIDYKLIYKKYKIIIFASFLFLIIVIFLSMNNKNKVDKSLDIYTSSINNQIDSNILKIISDEIKINSKMTEKEIVNKMSKFFNKFEYKYDMHLDSIEDFYHKKAGDCKEFSVAMAALLLYNKKRVYLVVRDSFYDGKETRVGHVYLGIDDFTNKSKNSCNEKKVLLFEPTPPTNEEKNLNSFERKEIEINDYKGKKILPRCKALYI